MRHPGRVYTRKMIFQAVWGTTEAPNSNVVESHLTRVRRKLRAAGIYGLLRNMHRLGYTFNP